MNLVASSQRPLLALLLLLVATATHGAVNIFVCEPEWGALARELGAKRVEVYVATTALQDPHRIEARPSLIARARNARLLICTGAELEAGWLPLVQAQAANPAIQPGRPGHFEAAQHARLLEQPQRVDRALGDVHAAGNPHLHLDPRNLAAVARALARRLVEFDPAGAAHYEARSKSFDERWEQAIRRWEQAAAPLKGAAVVVHHRDLTYLMHWLGLREAGALEPQPGMPPTTAHLTSLLDRLAREPAKAIVHSAYADPRAAQWLAGRAKIPAVVLPYTIGGNDKATDLFSLFEDTLARLLQSLR